MALENIHRGIRVDLEGICQVWDPLAFARREARMSQVGFREIRSANQVSTQGLALLRAFNQKPRIATLLTHITRAICFLFMQRDPLSHRKPAKWTDNLVIGIYSSETVFGGHVRISDYSFSALYSILQGTVYTRHRSSAPIVASFFANKYSLARLFAYNNIGNRESQE
jgi:hypothetical protein